MTQEASTPPNEPVKWIVQWEGGERYIDAARTAYEAWSQAKGAPMFASCRIVCLSLHALGWR